MLLRSITMIIAAFSIEENRINRPKGHDIGPDGVEKV